MSPSDGSGPATPESGPDSKPAAPGAVPTPSGGEPSTASPSAGRFAELLAGMAPLERIERLAVLETLSYGIVYEGRVFRASRAEPVTLLKLDPAFEAGSTFPPIVRNLLAASRIHGNHVVTPRGLYRDVEDLYGLYDTQTGLSLATGFDYLERNGLRLSAEAVLRIASGVLQALEELEREDASAGPGGGGGGRLRSHGLLIPENLFVTDDQRVLVRGIGIWQSEIAKIGRLGPRERRYLSPFEMTSGSASARSDLISLGAILFEAAAGFPAFDSPPTEDDLAEIVVRIDEIGAKAENSRRDLFGIAHACLSAVAVTASSRSRLRITVDTMFLREASREKVAGCITLEELAGRVKAARPAIVKAVALDLDPVEAPSRPPAIPLPPIAPASPAPDPSLPEAGDAAEPTALAGPAEPVRLAPAPATPAYLTPTKRGFEVHISQATAIWILSGIAAILLGFTIYSVSRPKPAVQPEEPFAPEPAAVASPASSASSSLSPADAAAPSDAASLAPTPDAAALAAAETAGQRQAALGSPVASAPAPAPAPAKPPRVGTAAREPARRPARGSGGAPPRGPVAAAPPASGAGASVQAPPADDPSLPPVAPGTLVTLGAPGVIPPAVTERPEDPRFSPADPRPASPGSVQLQLLIDERGRVLDHRILGASRFPPGISSGVAAYIARLRFKPAELRGVPVRVWIRHDMRFLAP